MTKPTRDEALKAFGENHTWASHQTKPERKWTIAELLDLAEACGVFREEEITSAEPLVLNRTVQQRASMFDDIYSLAMERGAEDGCASGFLFDQVEFLADAKAEIDRLTQNLNQQAAIDEACDAVKDKMLDALGCELESMARRIRTGGAGL